MAENALPDLQAGTQTRPWPGIAAAVAAAVAVVVLVLFLAIPGRDARPEPPPAAGEAASAAAEPEELLPVGTAVATATPFRPERPTPMPTVTPLPSATPAPEPIAVLLEAPVRVPFGLPAPARWSITVAGGEATEQVAVQIVNAGPIMLKSDVNTNEVVTRKTLRAGETWLIEAYIDPGTGSGRLELALTIRGETSLVSLPFALAETQAVVYETQTVSR
jgi:hypothetical protein